MSGTFGETALSLAGAAGALLGWRPGEFWAATPAELATILAALMPSPVSAVSAAELDRLQQLFPD